MGDLSKTIDIHLRGKGHPTTVNPEYGTAALGVGNGDDDLTVKTTRPSEGWIDQFRNIGCTNDNYIPTGNHPVHQCEELGNHPFFHVSQNFRALWCDGVDFIDKDDT